MNKISVFLLILFFINAQLVASFSFASASNLVENSWNVKTPMHQTRTDLGVVAVDGKIYAIGGYADAVGFVGTNERYNPETDSWVTLESMPTPRTGFAIVAYQNKIYCIGGSNPRLTGSLELSLDITEVYDIATDSWSTKTPLPVSEYFIQAHTMDEKICVVTKLALYVYDKNENSWTKKANIPAQVHYAFSTVMDNKLIIVNQVTQEINHDKYDMEISWNCTMKVMIYDPNTDVWREGQESSKYTNLPYRFICAGATTGVYAPEKIYVLFGDSNKYTYDPVKDTWSNVVGPKTYFLGSGVAVVDDILYIIGGTMGNINMQYVPIGYSNSLSSDTKFPLSIISITAVVITLSISVVVSLFFYFNKRG